MICYKNPMWFICFFTFALSIFFPAHADPVATVEGIARVKDGDTLFIGPVEIRFAGIDAPESEQRCRDFDKKTVEAGVMATAALKRMADGKLVRCEITDNKTTYNRVVAECFAGDVNLSREMVRQGWAYAYVRFSTAYLAEEKDARAQQRGVHAMKCAYPAYFRCREFDQAPAKECQAKIRNDYFRPPRAN
jgi:endonuclease YncB( thermonuclease family)